MKVLVTGASGRIGQQTVQNLAPKHELVLLHRSPVPENHGVASYQLDLTDSKKLKEIFAKELPSAVIHLAGLTGAACQADPVLTEKLNVESTRQLADLAIDHGVKKFIFASSAAVYHQTRLEPTDEISNINPVSAYGQSKLRAEQTLENISADSPTQFIVLRIFNVYGPGFDSSLINKLYTSTLDNPVTVIGPDKYYRDYIHVNEVVSSFQAALMIDALTENYLVLNIASGVATSTDTLLKLVRSSGVAPHYKSVPGGLDVSWGDITRAQELINFSPNKQIVFK